MYKHYTANFDKVLKLRPQDSKYLPDFENCWLKIMTEYTEREITRTEKKNLIFPSQNYR